MNFEMTGSIHLIEPTADVSASFRKREFVLEVPNERNNEWNDFVKFQLTQDRCALLDTYQLGQRVKVSFNIRGRKWEKDGRVSYFSSLEAWRIGPADGGSATASAPAQPSVAVTTPIQPAGPEEDLPF